MAFPGTSGLRGTVRLAGAPLADVPVVVRGPTGTSARTGLSGDYQFRDLWAGEYDVGIMPPLGKTCEVAHLTLEVGGFPTLDLSCNEIEGAWIVSYTLTDTRNCAYGTFIEKPVVFDLEGSTLTATFYPIGYPDIFEPLITMAGPYDRLTRYEGASPPIIVSLGLGYEPDALVESWRVDFEQPSGAALSASFQGVATLSSDKYGTCDFHVSGHGPPF